MLGVRCTQTHTFTCLTTEWMDCKSGLFSTSVSVKLQNAWAAAAAKQTKKK